MKKEKQIEIAFRWYDSVRSYIYNIDGGVRLLDLVFYRMMQEMCLRERDQKFLEE
jgi:hypothetical protein